MREAVGLREDYAVGARQEVVSQDRRHRDRDAEGSHDERLADRTCHYVDRRFAGRTDADERVIDAPDRTEQTHERRGRADRGEDGQAGIDTRLRARDGAIRVSIRQLVGSMVFIT